MTSKTIQKLGLPPFDRLPFRAPEPAFYREDALPEHANNPAYLAIPGMISQTALVARLTRHNLPLPDDKLRSEPAGVRAEAVNRIQSAFFPVSRVVDLYKMVLPSIRNSYLFRNPAERGFMEKLAASAATIGTGNPQSLATNIPASIAPVGCGSLVGEPGLGKSMMLKLILQSLCPQVIEHRFFKGQEIGLNQLAWLYVPCPPKCAIGALAWWIALILDYLFQTDTARRVLAAKTDPIRWRIACQALALHVTGLVVIDELQNITVGADESKSGVFEVMLQEAINTTSTRFLFCGTPEIFRAIRTSAMVRRMVGEEGQLRWRLYGLDSEWREYLTYLVQWACTLTPVRLTDTWVATMHELTDGNPDYAVKLFQKVQTCIIGDCRYPLEEITPDLLRQVWEKYFYRPAQKTAAAREARILASKSNATNSAADEDGCPHGQPTAKSAPDMGNQNPLPPPPPPFKSPQEPARPPAAAPAKAKSTTTSFSLSALVPGANA